MQKYLSANLEYFTSLTSPYFFINKQCSPLVTEGDQFTAVIKCFLTCNCLFYIYKQYVRARFCSVYRIACNTILKSLLGSRRTGKSHTRRTWNAFSKNLRHFYFISRGRSEFLLDRWGCVCGGHYSNEDWRRCVCLLEMFLMRYNGKKSFA